jgi:hypothetical protein
MDQGVFISQHSIYSRHPRTFYTASDQLRHILCFIRQIRTSDKLSFADILHLSRRNNFVSDPDMVKKKLSYLMFATQRKHGITTKKSAIKMWNHINILDLNPTYSNKPNV